jgi:CDP-diacylglycerol---glycerol-3-phosphate 3-phosphatidyltransferase
MSNYALASLRFRWIVFVVLCLGFGLGGYAILITNWEQVYAVRWGELTGLVLVYLSIVTWRNLDQNFREGENELLPDLGIGNIITLLRGVLIAGLAGFLLSPWPTGWLAWAPAALYFLACVGDFMDGALARLTRHATRLGKILDMDIDSLGVLISVFLVVFYGQAGAWFLLVALARYIFLAGLWVRSQRNLPVLDLPDSVRRRVMAGLLMALLAFLLLPAFSPPGTAWAAAAFAVPLLVGFAWDWLAVCGIARPGWPRPGWDWWLARQGAVFSRFLTVGLIVIDIWQFRSDGQAGAWLVVEAIIAVLLLFGILGRFAAGLGLVVLGVRQGYLPLTPVELALIISYTAVLILGTGKGSLWAPEDRLVYHRIGDAVE